MNDDPVCSTTIANELKICIEEKSIVLVKDSTTLMRVSIALTKYSII